MSTKMQTSRIVLDRSTAIFLIVLVIFSIGYLLGVAATPFHPDESTFLFLSRDFDLLFTDPAAMMWQPELVGDPVQRLRTLDAPLGRYLAGLGRTLAGLPPLPVDWDWGKTWLENQRAGAVPSAGLLLSGRLSMAVLFPFSLLLVFLTGRRLANDVVGWLAAGLLATNAVALLLTRRCVSEGGIIFTTALTLWALVSAARSPWLSGIPAALAFGAKHSLGALAPAGLLAVMWQPGVRLVVRLRHAAGFGLALIAITTLLNPFVWQHPALALRDAAAARQDLAQRQAADRPGQVLDTPARRLIGMVGAMYLTPPMFAETANYLEETRAAETDYLANPMHSLLRSLPGGGLLMILTLFGYGIGLARSVRRPYPRALILLLAATGLQAAALLLLVPLPFQRYYLPLIPHAGLWAAYGVNQVVKIAARGWTRQPRAAKSPTD